VETFYYVLFKQFIGISARFMRNDAIYKSGYTCTIFYLDKTLAQYFLLR